MSRPIYCVITQVPDPYKGEDGNLYHLSLGGDRLPESDIYVESAGQAKHRPLRYDEIKGWKHSGGLMMENFIVGEICILNRHTEREVSGRLRKPYKWNVDYVYFNSMEKAIAHAQFVTEEAQRKERVYLERNDDD